MPEPWLRPNDIITEVASWTGLDEDNLTGPGRRSNRIFRAKVLLARSLQVGLDCSKTDVARMMGYRSSSAHVIDHLFKKDFDATEVATVISLAKDRRRA